MQQKLCRFCHQKDVQYAKPTNPPPDITSVGGFIEEWYIIVCLLMNFLLCRNCHLALRVDGVALHPYHLRLRPARLRVHLLAHE